MADKEVGRHVFAFNPQDNGGEQLILCTTLFDNGDGEIYINQELTLHSYCNSASINLFGATISPAELRQMANELDEKIATAKVSAAESKAKRAAAQKAPATTLTCRFS